MLHNQSATRIVFQRSFQLVLLVRGRLVGLDGCERRDYDAVTGILSDSLTLSSDEDLDSGRCLTAGV